jgi:hypothetical protein
MKHWWNALRRWWREPIQQPGRIDWLASTDDEHILALLVAGIAGVSAIIAAGALAWVVL